MFTLCLILFFALTAFKDFHAGGLFYLARGIAALIIACLLILGRSSGF